MSPRLPSLLLAAAAASALAGPLSGCGRRGDLEQPAPLFGSRARVDAEANQATAQQGPVSTGVGGASTPEGETEDGQAFRRPREDLRDPSQRLEPASQNPIDAIEGSDPIGSPPPVTPRG